MISIKSVTIKNFMSVGNITQAIDLSTPDLTLVLGNNKDLGGNGNRNGVGKTSLINAISYGIYGAALSNIKRDNLINKANGKGMFVTVNFNANGVDYTIERGRRPNVFRFIVNGEVTTDEGQGEGKLTQHEINKVFGLNHVMFKYLVALNTYNEPFLSLGASAQREIIEHLLGITVLSEKATILKDKIRITKDDIKKEEYKIQGTETANIQIEKSIKDLKRRHAVWVNTNTKKHTELAAEISQLEQFDVEAELETHVLLEEFLLAKRSRDTLTNQISTLSAAKVAEEKTIKKAERDIAASTDHVCYTCGQSITDKKHTELLGKKKDAIAAATAVMDDINGAILELKKEFDSIEIADTAPKPEYASAQDAYNYKTKLSAAKHSLTTLDELVDPYTDQINQLTLTGMQAIDWSEVNRLQEILEHQDFLMKLLTNKDSFIRKKIISQNLAHLNLRLENYLIDLGLPHDVAFQSDLSVSITELGRDLDFDNLSRGERNRLILGLSWAFRDVYETANTPIDFLVIDELMDSGLDSSGVENALGILKKMHRERNKNIFLISHREELLNRVNNILYVSKENGFTSFSMSQDSEIE